MRSNTIASNEEKYTHECLAMVSRMEVAKPGGLMIGARATKTWSLSLSDGWMLNAAKACAVPWLKPI